MIILTTDINDLEPGFCKTDSYIIEKKFMNIRLMVVLSVVN